MKEKKMQQGIKDFPVYESNPGLTELTKIPTRNAHGGYVSKYKHTLDPETGEIEDTLITTVRKVVDQEQFIKLYRSQIAMIFNLPQYAQKVFAFFLNSTKMNSDQVFFSFQKCMEYTGYKSTSSISKGLVSLLEKSIIYRTSEPNIYFINPNVFFDGKRMCLLTDIVVKGSAAHMKQQKETAIEDAKAQQQLLFTPQSNVKDEDL